VVNFRSDRDPAGLTGHVLADHLAADIIHKLGAVTVMAPEGRARVARLLVERLSAYADEQER
jgi:hypothetical protein